MSQDPSITGTPSGGAIGDTGDAAVTSNAAGTLSAKLRGMVAIMADVWDSTNHWLKAQLFNATGAISSSNPLAVSQVGVGYSTSVAITRPSNTTGYTLGDVIGQADANTPANAGSAILTFAGMGPSGGHVLLTSCDLRIDLAAVPSGMSSFRMHLYGSSPTAILDNAAWDLVSGDRAAYRGYVDFGSPVDMGSTLWVQTDQVNRHIKLADGETSLYGLLVTNGTYTPASGTVYTPRLRTVAL